MSSNQNEEKPVPLLLTAMLTEVLKPRSAAPFQIQLSLKQNFALIAEQIFVNALERTVWGYRHNYDAVELISSMVANQAMEALATDIGISTLSDRVFGDAAIREFLFTLQVQFFSQIAEFNTTWTDLLDNIALSLCSAFPTSNAREDHCLIPQELRERTYSRERMYNLLLANNWLVIFILMSLWGRTMLKSELVIAARRLNEL